MHIVFSNGEEVNLSLNDSPLKDYYIRIYKHLQHITLPFFSWENPYWILETENYSHLEEKLVAAGKKLSIAVDSTLCKDQQYLNNLHEIYENNYNGNPEWLFYHELIHLCEEKNNNSIKKVLRLDYGEKMGPLQQSMQVDWLNYSVTKVSAGDAYVEWSELGKTPYEYWRTQEPNEIQRLCELAKPWITLIPKICIAVEDINFLTNKHSEKFNIWWDQYQEAWCKHWNLKSWSLKDQCSVIKLGHVTNFDKLINNLKNQINPIMVTL
jgi:hypothetical protein